MGIRPFTEGDAHATFDRMLENVIHDIESLDNDYVLNASVTELEDHYIQEGYIEPLRVHVDQQHIRDQTAATVDVSHDFRRAIRPGERAVVPGTCLRIAVPYDGDNWLWRIRASHYSTAGYPEIEVREDCIVLTISFADDTAQDENLKSRISMDIHSLAEAATNLSRDVEQHNQAVVGAVKAAIARKRERALAVKKAVDSIGIPMKRVDPPPTFAAPVKRRKLPVGKPPAPDKPFEPEPALDDAQYEHILSVVRSMSLVIERNPSSFSTLDEEPIRDHFLIQLNGHYEGTATGETFNASGKTDILIRVGDRNIFIAECKFWRGPKSFAEAIDQLLNYLTWRDSKCALLVFLREGAPTAILEKMHEVMRSRCEHRRTVAHDPKGDSRYILVKESDPGRELIITTQLYNVPSSKE